MNRAWTALLALIVMLSVVIAIVGAPRAQVATASLLGTATLCFLRRKYTSHKLRLLIAGACMGLLFASINLAQSTFGSITGTVADPSGGVVPNAQVNVTNVGTGAVRQTTTGTSGVYNVPNLDVGAYRLQVTAQGFSAYDRQGLTLVSNQVLNVNVELTVGSTSSVVEVQGSSPTITTETNDLSSSMPSRVVDALPIFARQKADGGIYSYALFQTGVGFAPGLSSVPIVQGSRNASGVLPTMDGIAVMAYPFGASPVQPSQESVQEINLVTANGAAEFATTGNYRVLTKSGTNEFHGGAFWSYNGNALNARNFFSAAAPFRVYNDFGASLGGPIKKNKIFFFGTYEGSREAATAINIMDVPLPEWRKGDFSSLLSRGTTVKNPFSGQPFPNNQIPSNLISPVSQKAQDYFYPLPNTGPPGALAANWRFQYPGFTGSTIFDRVDARVDYNISSRDSIFGRVSWLKIPLHFNDFYRLPGFVNRRAKSGVFSWNHTISPSIINEFRFGSTFHNNPYGIEIYGSDLLKQFGIQGISTAGIYNVPIFNITGVTAINEDGNNSSNNSPQTNFQWIDNLSWTRGKHLMKFGFDAIRDRLNGEGSVSSNIYGAYNFSGVYSGWGYGDFLLGIPQTTTVGIPNRPRSFRGTTWALYAQDQFKVSRSLTLNYGVRWQLSEPYHSKFGSIYNFNPQTGTLVVPDDGIKLINPYYPKNIPIVTASQAGYPANSLLDFRKNNLQPRIGFAYKPFRDDATVIRAGYGIYSNLIYSALINSPMTGGPFSGTVTYTNAITNDVPLFSFPSPFLSSGTTGVQNVNGVNPHLKIPYTQQWNLTLERQLGSIGVRASYMGTRSVDLIYQRNLNQPSPSAAPFSTARRPYQLYNQVVYADTGGTQFYNGLELGVQKRAGRNLTFGTGWTWAKDLTDAQDSGGGGSSFGGQLIQNQFDRGIEKADNPLVARRRFFGYVLYSLPVGKGQRYLSNAKGPLQQFLGGWDTAWNVVAQSGRRFTPSFSGFDPSNTNTIGGRPDVIPGVSLYPKDQDVNHWFSGGAFGIPGCPISNPVCANPANVGRFGNAGLNIVEGPPVRSLDFGILKHFQLSERKRLQFRMTMANALNHPNFGNPRANISSPGTVGTIASQVVALLRQGAGPREIDFGLRLQF